METVNKLGEFLVGVRRERKLSLKDVENATEISASYINRLEKGNRNNPSMYTLEKLSSFYGISPIKVMELSGYKLSTTLKETNSCQNLSTFVNSSNFLLIGGKQVSSEIFQSVVNKMLDLNIDSFMEVVNFLNYVKELQNSIE